jgi:hypothetical protein
VLRTLVFFGLITSAHANLDNLVNAAQSVAVAIDQQITTGQSDPAPTEFAEKTVAYADEKIDYYHALRAATPELTNIATGRKPRPQELNMFRDAFRVAGDIQEIAADKETPALLELFLRPSTLNLYPFRVPPSGTTERALAKTRKFWPSNS